MPAFADFRPMESEDHRRGGRKHHRHHHHNPDRKKQHCPQTRCRRGHRHVHADVTVLPDKDCPSGYRERHEQGQYGVASERIWLGLVHRMSILGVADRTPILL